MGEGRGARHRETSKTQGARGDAVRLGPGDTRPQIEGQETQEERRMEREAGGARGAGWGGGGPK